MVDDEIFDEDDDYVVVDIVDEDGKTYPYVQEMIIPVGDDKFALLVPIDEEEHEHEHGDGCDCGCEDDDVIIAKMVENEDGEIEYIEPTDEEFKLVEEAYDSLFEEEDE